MSWTKVQETLNLNTGRNHCTLLIYFKCNSNFRCQILHVNHNNLKSFSLFLSQIKICFSSLCDKRGRVYCFTTNRKVFQNFYILCYWGCVFSRVFCLPVDWKSLRRICNKGPKKPCVWIINQGLFCSYQPHFLTMIININLFKKKYEC